MRFIHIFVTVALVSIVMTEVRNLNNTGSELIPLIDSLMTLPLASSVMVLIMQ